MGRVGSSIISPAWRLVSGTSAVGMRKPCLPLRGASSLKRSSSNLGNCPVPSSASRPTRYGTITSVYPCFVVCVSTKNEMSARSSRASEPLSTAKREPESLAAASISRPPSALATSSCHSRPLGSSPSQPHEDTSMFASSSAPSGVRGSSKLGSVSKRPFRSASIASICSSAALAMAAAVATSALSSSAAPVSPFFMRRPILGESALRCARAAFPFSTSTARSLVSSPMRETAASCSSAARRMCSERRTNSGSSTIKRSSSISVAGRVSTAACGVPVRDADRRSCCCIRLCGCRAL
mmetsp:Transcript_23312/g.50271  ORF Transcript_23312/g.50271 Transcript_23312/m.50271 type:complete len:296 (-) Transcript_23312:88-975(-)